MIYSNKSFFLENDHKIGFTFTDEKKEHNADLLTERVSSPANFWLLCSVM